MHSQSSQKKTRKRMKANLLKVKREVAVRERAKIKNFV